MRFLVDDPRVTRQSHLYPRLRYYQEKMHDVPAEAFAAALLAEGIPCSARRSVPLYQHPLFADRRFDPPGRASRIRHPASEVDYAAVHCPVAESMAGRFLGMPQTVLLGDDDTAEQVLAAFEKVMTHLDEI